MGVALNSPEFVQQQVEYYQMFFAAVLARAARQKHSADSDDSVLDHQGPPLPIDLIWHCHQLRYLTYRRDCVAVFGSVLAHAPRQRHLDNRPVERYTKPSVRPSAEFVSQWRGNARAR